MYNVYKRMTSSATRKSSVSFKLAAVSYTVGSTAANIVHSLLFQAIIESCISSTSA